MGDLLVHADAGGAGKIINKLRAGASTGLLEKPATDHVELRRRHARFQGRRHGLERIGDDPADVLELVQIILVGDRHGLSSFMLSGAEAH
jgi:hypothetical protein